MNQSSNDSTNVYRLLFTDLADPRTNSWFLIDDPILPLTILGLYLYFVLSWGPRFMKNRKPFELKNVLVIYNFLQVLLSTWLVVEAVDILFTIEFSWMCQPVDFSDSPNALRITRACYIYFLAKMTELLDTIFFVIRKKDKQITFLHVYHHTAMPMISWGATKYYPGGHGAIVGLNNSIVHIVMYTYYMMSAMGPRYQRFLWWKKYITTMQMVQFGVAFLHNSQLLFVDCGYPRWSVVFTLPNAIFFYILFSDFYQKAYLHETKKSNGETVEQHTAEKRSSSEHKLNGYNTGGVEISNKKLA